MIKSPWYVSGLDDSVAFYDWFQTQVRKHNKGVTHNAFSYQTLHNICAKLWYSAQAEAWVDYENTKQDVYENEETDTPINAT